MVYFKIMPLARKKLGTQSVKKNIWLQIFFILHSNYWMRLGMTSWIINVKVSVICQSQRQITQTWGLIVHDITYIPNSLIIIVWYFLNNLLKKIIPSEFAEVWSMVLRETVSFVFPRVLTFPETNLREISGLEGKQN